MIFRGSKRLPYRSSSQYPAPYAGKGIIIPTSLYNTPEYVMGGDYTYAELRRLAGVAHIGGQTRRPMSPAAVADGLQYS